MPEINLIIAYIIGIIILFLIGKVLLLPIKFLLKLIYNALIGGIILIIINLFGNFINFDIPVNFISALIVGILGIPGIALLVILKYFFV